MAWYDGLILRNTKDITEHGLLLSKLYGNYRKSTEIQNKISKKELCEKANLTDARMTALFNGLFPEIQRAHIVSICEAIQVPVEIYDTYAKATSIPGVGIYCKPVIATQAPAVQAPVASAPAKPQPVAASKPTTVTPASQPVQSKPAPEKSASKNIKGLTFENYVEEPLILIIDETNNKIEIHPNYTGKTPATKGKIVLVPNSIIFGGKLVPGKVVI